MSFVPTERARALSTDKRKAEIIIVGAGAVGLLTALKLGRAGIDTIVLEAYNDILRAPRAIAYMPVVVKELQKLGIYDRLKAIGEVNNRGVTWRSQAGEEYAYFDPEQERLTLGQDKVALAVLGVLKEECPTVQVIFGQRGVGLEQETGAVRVMTTGDEEDHIWEAKFVLGCDGANSSVRRMSMIPFEGFTWKNFRFTAVDVDYDFVGHCGFPQANMVVDPEEWAVIAKTGNGNIWRVCYGERPELSLDKKEMNDRAHGRIMGFLKPMNKDGIFDYKITRLSPYWAHQRCATTYRKGNVLLAGDAAHSNNPVGGLGLTGGILDAVVFGNALIRHLRGGEPDEIITKAAEARRSTWLSFINPTSQTNFRRLFSVEDADASEREAFFKKLNQADEQFLAAARSHTNLLPDDFEPVETKILHAHI
ncbi:hypothetical protein PV10_05459 [Exophiala mesophila]|uniref:FAD-binding domain-containing protein n=1 Tax=Exophiala mesophila TaxID=212818 RepID=A0A0D1ZVK7_EXOME|nr:uncharacterized protein PV10_05459 [Exophiala mesophila]KIV90853.1 hypothetical protein PV10_05459 [Exophiala mesophila]